jgi:hypothetical protein
MAPACTITAIQIPVLGAYSTAPVTVNTGHTLVSPVTVRSPKQHGRVVPPWPRTKGRLGSHLLVLCPCAEDQTSPTCQSRWGWVATTKREMLVVSSSQQHSSAWACLQESSFTLSVFSDQRKQDGVDGVGWTSTHYSPLSQVSDWGGLNRLMQFCKRFFWQFRGKLSRCVSWVWMGP